MEYSRAGHRLTARQQLIYAYLVWANAKGQDPGVSDIVRDVAQTREVVVQALLALKRRGLVVNDGRVYRPASQAGGSAGADPRRAATP